jgi:hypothetical protein
MLPEAASRNPTPEEIAKKLAEAQAHIARVMDVIVPGHRKIRTFIAVTATLIAIATLGLFLLITTKLFSIF